MMTVETPAKIGSKAKPDGWHLYHICAGRLRELTNSPAENKALCLVCGQWATLRVEKGR